MIGKWGESFLQRSNGCFEMHLKTEKNKEGDIMFKTSMYNATMFRIFLFFVTALLVLPFITNTSALAGGLIYIDRPNVPLSTCKTNGEWVNTQNGKYSNKLGSSIIWREFIEEEGTYSIDFSNEVLGVKYEIMQGVPYRRTDCKGNCP